MNLPPESSAKSAARRALLSELEAAGFQNRKSLGQNFLFDPRALASIVRVAGVNQGDAVIEIGAGTGTLTAALAEGVGACGQVLTWEIDERLRPLLLNKMMSYPQVNLMFEDARKANFSTAVTGGIAAAQAAVPRRALRVVANLPYYITSELIERLLLQLPQAESLTVLVQDEAASRLLAEPGDSKAYGPLALLLRLYGSGRTALSLPPSVFLPSPHVRSALLCFTPPSDMDAETDALRAALLCERERYYAFVCASFARRRKTLLNNLRDWPEISGTGWLDGLLACGLPADVRAEELSWQDLGRLFMSVNRY